MTLVIENSELEAMAHRNRWFSQLETSICEGFSIAMFNNQMVVSHSRYVRFPVDRDPKTIFEIATEIPFE